MTTTSTQPPRRRVPPLSRRYLIGFATGALVMAIAAAGVIAALGFMAAPQNDDLLTWPPLAKADDCGYAISVSEWLSVPEAHDARAYVDALAEAWARRGWNVDVAGDASSARLIGHFGKATQQVEARLTEDGLRAGASGQQCATPPSP